MICDLELYRVRIGEPQETECVPVPGSVYPANGHASDGIHHTDAQSVCKYTQNAGWHNTIEFTEEIATQRFRVRTESQSHHCQHSS